MTHDDSYAQANGHPPSAGKTVCVDFDGTIIPWGPLMEMRDVFPGIDRAVNRLHHAGYRIVILTSRMSPTWWEAEAEARGVDATAFGDQQYKFVVDVLHGADMWYDLITAEKVPALVYFDDKAEKIDPGWPLDRAIDHWLLWDAPSKEPQDA